MFRLVDPANRKGEEALAASRAARKAKRNARMADIEQITGFRPTGVQFSHDYKAGHQPINPQAAPTEFADSAMSAVSARLVKTRQKANSCFQRVRSIMSASSQPATSPLAPPLGKTGWFAIAGFIAVVIISIMLVQPHPSSAVRAYQARVEVVAASCSHLIGPTWDAMPATGRADCERRMRLAISDNGNLVHEPPEMIDAGKAINLHYFSRFPSNADFEAKFRAAGERYEDQARRKEAFRSSSAPGGFIAFVAVLLLAVLLAADEKLRAVLKEVAICEFRPRNMDGTKAIYIQSFSNPLHRSRVRLEAVAFLFVGYAVFIWTVQAIVLSWAAAGKTSVDPGMGFPVVLTICGFALPVFFMLLSAAMSATKRVVEWEGPARMEKGMVNGEMRWVRRGNPHGDPVTDDPRAAHTPAPAKAGYRKVFNDRTGEYEWVQILAAKDGDPNRQAHAPQFKPSEQKAHGSGEWQDGKLADWE